MQNGFRNILIPVFPYIDAEGAFKKALNMCDDEGSIHLVIVHNTFLSVTDKLVDYSSAITRKLVDKWISCYPDSAIHIKVEYKKAASLKDAILDKVQEDKADLIIMGMSNKRYPFYNSIYPGLAEIPGCSVLKLKQQFENATTVVVPFNQISSSQTLQNIRMMNKNNAIHVHLLQYSESDSTNQEHATIELLRAYQCIKSCRCPVEYSIIYGDTRKKALKKYVDKIANDVMLLDCK